MPSAPMGITIWAVIIGVAIWFKASGWKKIQPRFLARPRLSAVLVLAWLVSGSLALGYLPVSNLVAAKATDGPKLMQAALRLGYKPYYENLYLARENRGARYGLTFTDPRSKKPWPDNTINFWVCPNASDPDLIQLVAHANPEPVPGWDAHLYHAQLSNRVPVTVVRFADRAYLMFDGNEKALMDILAKSQGLPTTKGQELSFYYDLATFQYRMELIHHSGGSIIAACLVLPVYAYEVAAMLWAPVIALLPAGALTLLPLWLWLIVLLTASMLVTVQWLRATRPDGDKEKQG
ncbi:MAG: hypothetical protein H5U02_11360 [Clostridia bacterium]|nr:hypothetical protein [Clostridia bacterium]